MPSTPSYSFAGTSTTEKQITGLSANTRYYFWVVALGTKVYYKDSDPVSTNQKTLNLAQLPTPTLSKDSSTTTSIKVKWNQVYTTANDSTVYATRYRVYYSTTTTRNDSNYVEVGGSITSYNFTGLATASTYYYWIQAIGDGVLTTASTISGRVGYTTDTPHKLVVTVGDTTNLTTNSATVNWSVDWAGSDYVSNIRFCTGSSCSLLGYNITSRTITGLQPDTPYSFTVEALGQANITQNSDPKTISIRTLPLTQLYITNLQVTSISAKSVSISWEVSGSPIDSIRLYKNISTLVSVTGQAVRTYTFTGLEPNTTYQFGVLASGVSNQSLTSQQINTSNVKTLAQTTPTITASQNASTKTSVSLSWDYTPTTLPSSDVTYDVYTGTTPTNITTKAKSGLTSKQTTLTGLSSGKTYYAKVALITTNENFKSVTSSTVTLLTNYIDTTKTTYSLKSFNATYNGGNDIPASGTGTNTYMTPTNVSASSVTSYTVCDYDRNVVSTDSFEDKTVVYSSSLTFVGTKSNTGLDISASTGAIKVDTRGANSGNQ
jgi:hypothetical protein